MRNRNSIIIGVLAVFLFTGNCCVFAQPAPAKNAKAKPASATAAPKPKIEKEVERKRSDIRYTGFETKRDPFTPPAVITQMLEKPDKIPGAEAVAKDIALPAIDLQGIIWSKTVPQVIINSSVMKVGDFIEEFQIKEIRQTGIILFFKGNDYFIKMGTYTKPKSFKRKR